VDAAPEGFVHGRSIEIVSSLLCDDDQQTATKTAGFKPPTRSFILTTDVGFNRANHATQWHRSKIAQAIHLLSLAVTAAAIHVPRAHADSYVQDISTANGANGISPTNSGNGGNNDGKGGAAPGNVQSAGAWYWYDPAPYASSTGPAVWVLANGGKGGNGGNAFPGLLGTYQNGGAAANGGAAGLLDLGFYGSLLSSSSNPTVLVTAQGGDGGAGGSGASTGATGAHGQGAAGGTITLSVSGSVTNTAPYSGNSLAPAAVLVLNTGGNGGGDDNGSSRTSSDHAYGTPGGQAGSGFALTAATAITFTTAGNKQVASSIGSQGPGVVLISSGGNGGQGAQAITTGLEGATGGDGGRAGNGGGIIADTSSTAISARGVAGYGTGDAISLDPDHPEKQGAISFVSGAVIAQSLGGAGGLAGTASAPNGAKAGAGGMAGTAGQVSVSTSGNLTSTGYGAAGIVAQSAGGSGGNGATAGAVFGAKAGGGGVGGDGNMVFVTANSSPSEYALISTSGDDADGIIAQSIGGGGGNGGSLSVGSFAGAAVAIGGRGETGGNGSTVAVNIGSVDPDTGAVSPGAIVSTNGLRSAGIVAQSVGGGGGNGGSAYSTAVGSPASLAIGGNGGTGGDAGVQGNGIQYVQVTNRGFVQTAGEHAAGILAQTLGGGGGSGGAAHSYDAGIQVTTAAAVGGTAGAGGVAGALTVDNQGTIITMNVDSFGVLAQSIGGGGGQGGSSWAETMNAFNFPDVPSVNVTTSIGGNGGTGGNADAVTVHNSGIIFTQQAGSMGVYAQSVGGGGGTGGMSGAAEIATQSSTVNASVTVGGRGKGGGQGGQVTVTNDAGLVMTFGENAIGIWGQSIGGGGGYGGAAKSDTASFLSENKSLTIGVDVGGSAGVGNIGGNVSVTNTGGSVLTLGDGARGVAAQSVGGGGGFGGGSSAGSSGGKIDVNISVGGNGGSGGDSGTVTVTNSGSVVTFGGKADGIFAHSVGGAGGVGGNAATGGGTDPELRLTDFIQQGLGIGATTTTLLDNIYGFAKDELIGDKAIAALRQAGQNYLDLNKPTEPVPDSTDTSWNWSIDIGVGVGGKGGSGGNGNAVTVTNSGTVATIGANSAGIYAQSVGGGGGVGGAATTVNNNQGLAQKNIPISGTLGVGGTGGSGGHGGDVTVTHTGIISTEADASAGIHAQSVGAGGGDGGGTVSSWTQVHLTEISIGGDGGASGDGGAVNVIASDSNGSITTMGNSSIGVLAQSIGGGGGTLTMMESAPASKGGTMSSNISWLPQHVNATLVPFRFSGANGTSDCGSTSVKAANCGNGSTIDVQVANISTSGAGSHAVVAQSAGGGGGVLLGNVMTNGDLFGAATSTATVGNANKVSITTAPGTVQTTGAGAFGILAQSNGGGALIGGDFSASGPAGSAAVLKVSNTHLNGNGGDINVTVNEGSGIKTSGAWAHGIFAQSVGGGGALIATSDGLAMGTAGGVGTSGAINVTVNGSVATTGSDASGVVINAEGSTASPNAVNLTVGTNGSVTSSNSSAAVVVLSSAASNTITNNGVIGAPGGYAIASFGSGITNVVNSGWMTGDVYLGQGTFQIVGSSGGWAPGASSTASVFTNNVEIDLSGRHTFNGNLTNNNLIYSPVDFVNGTGGTLNVTGTATMSGNARFLIEPTTLAAKPFAVLTASYFKLDVIPRVDARNGGQFTYSLGTESGGLTITPQANVGNTAQQLSGSQATINLARHLDAGFTSSLTGEMASHYAALANVGDGATLIGKLGALGNEGVQSVGTSHLARSHGFVDRMNSCPQFGENGVQLTEQPCTWARVIGNQTNRDAGGSSAGYKNEDFTAQIGGQLRLADNWFVGGSLSADNSRARDSAGNASVKGSGLTVGAVLKRQLGNWLVSGAVDAGVADYDSRRRVQLGTVDRTADASFDAQHIGIHARVAHQIPFSSWYLKPYVDVHATRMRTSSYTESGAGALDLRVSRSSDSMFAVSPMVEIGQALTFANDLRLHTYTSAGLTVYNDKDWGADAQLAGIAGVAGTFRTVSSAPASRAKVALGANLLTRQNFNFKFEYSGEFASHYRSNTGSLKLSYLY
jgi:hypothetical protein